MRFDDNDAAYSRRREIQARRRARGGAAVAYTSAERRVSPGEGLRRVPCVGCGGRGTAAPTSADIIAGEPRPCEICHGLGAVDLPTAPPNFKEYEQEIDFDTCPVCNGLRLVKKTCRNCHGLGKVRRT